VSDTDYILDLVTAPVGHAVLVADVMTFLRVDDAEEIGVISELIDAATSYVQENSGKQLLTATYDVSWRRFDGAFGELVLPRVPVSSVTSVKYYNTAGTLTTLSSTLYTVNDGSEHAASYIVPAFNEQWPSTYGHDRDVVVRFVCGYGDIEDVPASFKLQIKMLVAHWYENRAAVSCGAMQKTPLAFTALEQFNRHQEFV